MCHPVYRFAQTALLASVRCDSGGSGSRPLEPTLPILEPHWNFSHVYCCCPVSWRFCRVGSARPAPSSVRELLRWGRCRHRMRAWVVSELVSLPALLCLRHQGQLCSGERQSQLVSSHTFWAALPHCIGESQGQFSCACVSELAHLPSGRLTHTCATRSSSSVLIWLGAGLLAGVL